MAIFIDNKKKAQTIAQILRAVAHPIRIRIIAVLCDKEQHVNALSFRLGVSQPIVSQQLRILRARGLVSVSRKDGFAYYKLAEPHLRELVCCMEKCNRE